MRCRKDSIDWIDLNQLWDMLSLVPHSQKLTQLLKLAGVEFYADSDVFIKTPSANICGIGGIPVTIKENEPHLLNTPLSTSVVQEAFLSMIGASAAMSYLNPKNQSLLNLAEKSLSLNHFSCTHTVYINILIAGYSCGVENELNSQRDLVHLSRITVARTKAQAKPPLVVLDEADLPFYKSLYAHLSSLDEENLSSDRLESRNLLQPAAKAQAAILSGTLRNILKLLALIDDPSKEFELRRLLLKCKQTLSPLVGPIAGM